MSPEGVRRNFKEATWTLVLFVPTGWLLASVVASLLLLFQTKLYESVVVLEEKAPGRVGELIEIPPSLYGQVMVRLDWRNRWPEGETAEEIEKALVDSVSVTRVPQGNTEIRVLHSSAQDARDIAHSLAENFPGWTRVGEEFALSREDQKVVRELMMARLGGLEANKKQAELIARGLEPKVAALNLSPPEESAIVVPTEMGKSPVRPRVDLWLVVARTIGVLGGVVAWYCYLRFIRNPEKAAERKAARKKEEYVVPEY